MNLFILSLDPKQIAKWMMDKHIVKIITEAAQMLSTAKRCIDEEYLTERDNQMLYKMAHKNHPVSKWVRESYANFIFALDLCDAMHDEWRFRYSHSKQEYHKAYLVVMYIRNNIPPIDRFSCTHRTPFALAMPLEYKTDCPVKSYQNYYNSPEKQRIATWKKRNVPGWFGS
jgi:hypothetical protein